MATTHRKRSGGFSLRSRRTVLVGIAGLLVAGAALTAVIVLDDDPAPSPSAATAKPAKTPPGSPFGNVRPIGTPDRIVIPQIAVDAKVLPVGTTSKNAQEVPSSLHETGWWRDGSRPGQPGNAVIVGHTASKADGVFDRLGDLETGDTITLRSGKKKLTFTVSNEQEIEVAKFATVADEIYRETGPSGVVLMTCGDWNGTAFETTVIVTARAA